MALLIDGYNLLHASGILARGIGPATLERSRNALLNFLAASLDEATLARTIVVFDAGVSASGRVRSLDHKGIQIRFSAGKADADDLIEELIRADSAPRRLTVVSSDHRIQRAAHRRKALAIDSDKWFAGVLRSRSERGQHEPSPEPPRNSSGGLLPHEVQYWLARFGLEDFAAENETRSAEPADDGSASEPQPPRETSDKVLDADAGADGAASRKAPGRLGKHRRSVDRIREDKPKPTSALNPFPPGYAEDVFDEE